MKNYHSILKGLRTDNDKSQREIAEILEITAQQYQLYESGKRKFKPEHIRTLCKYYGVSADYVLDLPKGLNYPDK